MNSKKNKISISELSDDMVLKIIHEEFMKLNLNIIKNSMKRVAYLQFQLFKKGLV